MGRTKSKLVKRYSRELLRLHKNKFSESFDKNQEVVKKYLPIASDKLINVTAGYVTRLVKKGLYKGFLF